MSQRSYKRPVYSQFVTVVYRIGEAVDYWRFLIRSPFPRGTAVRRVLEMHPTAEIIRCEL